LSHLLLEFTLANKLLYATLMPGHESSLNLMAPYSISGARVSKRPLAAELTHKK